MYSHRKEEKRLFRNVLHLAFSEKTSLDPKLLLIWVTQHRYRSCDYCSHALNLQQQWKKNVDKNFIYTYWSYLIRLQGWKIGVLPASLLGDFVNVPQFPFLVISRSIGPAVTLPFSWIKEASLMLLLKSGHQPHFTHKMLLKFEPRFNPAHPHHQFKEKQPLQKPPVAGQQLHPPPSSVVCCSFVWSTSGRGRGSSLETKRLSGLQQEQVWTPHGTAMRVLVPSAHCLTCRQPFKQLPKTGRRKGSHGLLATATFCCSSLSPKHRSHLLLLLLAFLPPQVISLQVLCALPRELPCSCSSPRRPPLLLGCSFNPLCASCASSPFSLTLVSPAHGITHSPSIQSTHPQLLLPAA